MERICEDIVIVIIIIFEGMKKKKKKELRIDHRCIVRMVYEIIGGSEKNRSLMRRRC